MKSSEEREDSETETNRRMNGKKKHTDKRKRENRKRKRDGRSSCRTGREKFKQHPARW